MPVRHIEKLRPIQPEAIQSPGSNQTLERLLVHRPVIHPLEEIEQILERPPFLPFLDNRIDSRHADTLYRRHAETDIPVMVHREIVIRLVHIRGQHLQSHTLTLVHKDRHLRDIRQVTTQVGRHKLRGIMCLQESGLVSDISVTNRVRFIERVGSESLPVAPYLLHQRFDLLAHLLASFHELGIIITSLQELGFQGIHGIDLFLTHRLTQGIGHTPGKIPESTRLQHHLLLIDRDPVSIFQVRLHHRVIVLDRCLPVFTLDKIGDILHRSRSVQGIHRHQILETVRFQRAQVLLHSRRLKLEQSGRVAS